MHMLVEQSALYVMLTMVGIAAVSDWKTGLIPNAVVALGAGLGVMVQLLAVTAFRAPPGETLARMGLGFLVCTTLPSMLYALGAMGGGDLKLFAAIGLCAGPRIGLDIQVLAHLVAVVALPLYFLRHGGMARALDNFTQIARNCAVSRARRTEVDALELATFRFAPAILVASLVVVVARGVLP